MFSNLLHINKLLNLYFSKTYKFNLQVNSSVNTKIQVYNRNIIVTASLQTYDSTIRDYHMIFF